MKIFGLLSGAYSVLLLGVVCLGQEDDYAATELTLRRVLGSISAALKFMDEDYDKLNLDAVIGLRLVEGQLHVLQRHLTESELHPLADDILESINRNKLLAGFISNRSLPIIQNGQANYYRDIGFIIQSGFWEHDYPSRNLDLHHVRRPRVQGEVMHESESDNCLQELRTDMESTGYKCDVSMSCWKLMTSPGYRYYSLSHEIFYLLIGEATNCFSEKSIINHRLIGEFCASMLVEARTVAFDDFPRAKQDLFMEDAALCGIYGYRQFFNSDWLENILSWQRLPRGCWGMNDDEMTKAREEESGRRVKREERVLPDGCECHRTAVALGALTQYVRYTTEYMQSISGYDFF